MNRILNLKKGDKCIVAIIPMSNASRHINMSLSNINNWTYEGEVVTVGRKYITVKWIYGDMKFDPEFDFEEHSNYSPNYKLYKDIQEIRDITEIKEIEDFVRTKFNNYYGDCKSNLTLEQLRKIKNIIENNEE